MPVVLALAGLAYADQIEKERPVVQSALEASELIYTYVPLPWTNNDWARRHLSRMRFHARANHLDSPIRDRQANNVFREMAPVVDLGTDEILPLQEEPEPEPLSLETEDMNTAIFGGGSGFSLVLADLGLSMDALAELHNEIPPFVRTVAVYVRMVNDRTIRFALHLRFLFGGDDSMAVVEHAEGGGSADEMLEVETGKPKGTIVEEEDEPSEEEKLREKQRGIQSARRVVRSAFRIIVGFLLGLLLWSFVRGL